jgi:hypothetical protein
MNGHHQPVAETKRYSCHGLHTESRHDLEPKSLEHTRHDHPRLQHRQVAADAQTLAAASVVSETRS